MLKRQNRTVCKRDCMKTNQKFKIVTALLLFLISPNLLGKMASPTVYGKARLSLVAATTSGEYSNQVIKAQDIKSHDSRLGLKGSENLGEGNKGFYQFEMDLNPYETSAIFSNRSSFVGISNDSYGELLLGRNDTPYKQAMGNFDHFADTIADINRIIGSVSGTKELFINRGNNMIQYTSPKLHNLQLKTSKAFDSSNTETRVRSTVALTFSKKNLYVATAYEVIKNRTGTDGRGVNKGILGTIQYKCQSSTIGIIYEGLSNNFDNGSDVRNAWAISYNFEHGKNSYRLAYGMAGKSKKISKKDGAMTVSIGAFRDMSSSFQTYLLLSHLDNDADGKYGYNVSTTGPIAPGETNSASGNLSAGANVNVLALGMNFNF